MHVVLLSLFAMPLLEESWIDVTMFLYSWKWERDNFFLYTENILRREYNLRKTGEKSSGNFCHNYSQNVCETFALYFSEQSPYPEPRSGSYCAFPERS